jgi:hypothetical protein
VPQMQEERLARHIKGIGADSGPSGAKAKISKEKPTINRLLVVEANDPSIGGVQRPRVFYRREREPRPLIVARP